MAMFKISNNIRIVCESKGTRSGFNHFATVYVNDSEKATAKVHYINRTWEAYEFDTVIERVAQDPRLTPAQQDTIKDWVKHRDGHDDEGMKRLGSIGALAMMGEVLGSDLKQKNRLRATALKSVQGIDLPDDWESLSEVEKKRRLDGALGVLKKR
jgi:hypothetical protein